MFYNVDEASMDEDPEAAHASHRCSQVKRYNLPTFFTPDKRISISSKQEQSRVDSPEMASQMGVLQPNTLKNDTINELTEEDAEQSRISMKFYKDEEDEYENLRNNGQSEVQVKQL